MFSATMRVESSHSACVVDRGVRLVACCDPTCCCAALPDEAMAALAERVSSAWASADLDAIRDQLSAPVKWGSPEQNVPTCRNRDQVLKFYEAARGGGARATITETMAYADAIMLGLNVLRRRAPPVGYPRCVGQRSTSVTGGLSRYVGSRVETRHTTSRPR